MAETPQAYIGLPRNWAGPTHPPQSSIMGGMMDIGFLSPGMGENNTFLSVGEWQGQKEITLLNVYNIVFY